jgi:hypothetical protein
MLLAVVISYLSGVFGDKHGLDAETRNALIITANGPAVCFSRRNSTQAPGRIPVPRFVRGQKTVTVQGGYGALFAVMVQN